MNTGRIEILYELPKDNQLKTYLYILIYNYNLYCYSWQAYSLKKELKISARLRFTA